jgi:uncharacterized protein YbdZ (MbtH family)
MKKTILGAQFEHRVITIACAWTVESMRVFGNTRQCVAWCSLDGEWALVRPAKIKLVRGRRKMHVYRSEWAVVRMVDGLGFSCCVRGGSLDHVLSLWRAMSPEHWREDAEGTRRRWTNRSMQLGD